MNNRGTYKFIRAYEDGTVGVTSMCKSTIYTSELNHLLGDQEEWESATETIGGMEFKLLYNGNPFQNDMSASTVVSATSEQFPDGEVLFGNIVICKEGKLDRGCLENPEFAPLNRVELEILESGLELLNDSDGNGTMAYIHPDIEVERVGA